MEVSSHHCIVAGLDLAQPALPGPTQRDLVAQSSSRVQGRDGPFLEIGRVDSSFFTLSRKAVLRSVGLPCFFNKSLKASSASSWKSIIRSRASKLSACHVSSSVDSLAGHLFAHFRFGQFLLLLFHAQLRITRSDVWTVAYA